jgi:aspartate carbamoyltransferase regulatory subunit
MKNPFKKDKREYYVVPAKCPNCRLIVYPRAPVGVKFSEYHKDTKEFTCWYCGCSSPAEEWEFFPDFDSRKAN